MKQEADIRQLKGIGEKTAKLFEKLSVHSIGELLACYPRDYEKLGQPVAIREIGCDEVCTVRASVVKMSLERAGRKALSNVLVKDETGGLALLFFHMPYLKNILKPGQYYVFRGIVRQKGAGLVMEQPKIYAEQEYRDIAGTMQPVYALTEGISNQTVKKAVKQSLELLTEEEDCLPEKIRQEYHLREYPFCIRQIHFPESAAFLAEARKRFVFEEFLTFQLLLQNMKQQNTVMTNENKMIETADAKRLIEALPYQLTKAQQKVWKEIEADMCGERTMNRLVQGDVGSGKTIVAVLALLLCAANGYQGAMMAPTEVLARQHFEQIRELTVRCGLCLKPALLTGSTGAAARKEIYAGMESGELNLLIGTHALIQEKVNYRRLGLVVTDEQHRFGVRQREKLAQKGEHVHVLVMSATPIPRTLAIVLYGDLDVSVIDELPADRLPIKNCVVGKDERRSVYRFIEKEVTAGRQAYVICPMVEEGETEDLENVTAYTEKLRKELPQGIQIASLYGSMKSADKNRIMEEFAAHNIDVLVSTTVIEVGINVVNATVMVVENAERFGLSQLHQLRGRVGRGRFQSYCVFISGSKQEKTMERLNVLLHSNDGFRIAEEDLRLRGPGDFFGIRQSGIMDFKLGDVFTDTAILQEAKECAVKWSDSEELKKYREGRAENYVDFQSL